MPTSVVSNKVLKHSQIKEVRRTRITHHEYLLIIKIWKLKTMYKKYTYIKYERSCSDAKIWFLNSLVFSGN